MDRSMTTSILFPGNPITEPDKLKQMMNKCLSDTLNGTSNVSKNIFPASFDDELVDDAVDIPLDCTSISNEPAVLQGTTASNGSTTTGSNESINVASNASSTTTTSELPVNNASSASITTSSNESAVPAVNTAGDASNITRDLPCSNTGNISCSTAYHIIYTRGPISAINSGPKLKLPGRSPMPLEKFDLYPKLPIELRRMVVKEAMPEPAIIVLRHETLCYPSRGQTKRTVRYNPELSVTFTLADLRKSRCLALGKVNTEFREVYLFCLPKSIKICQARRERKESKLRFCEKDLLYLCTFFGRIPIADTMVAIYNTPSKALPFETITQLAFSGKVLTQLVDDNWTLTEFLDTFPSLQEIKVLDHDIPAKLGRKKYTDGGSHGANPYPKKSDYLEMTEHWTVQVDVLINMVKKVEKLRANGERVIVPKITFL